MTASASRRRHWTLQARLITAAVGMVAIILGAVGLATGTILSSIMQQTLDLQVEHSLSQLRGGPASTASDILSDGRQEAGTLLVYRNPLGAISGAYVASDETVTALTGDQIDDIVGDLGHAGTATMTIEGLGEYRVRLTSDTSGPFAVIGLPTSDMMSTLAQILTTVALVTIGGLLVLGVLLAILIRRSLAPLRAVADTAERVARQPLSEGEVRITERVPAAQADDGTEIGRVGASLNTLLDHVETSLEARQRNEERMRRFVADASHELRTPLASIRGYSELSLRALRQAQGPTRQAPAAGVYDDTESALDRIQAQSLRMTALVEDLLLLARLEEGQELVYGTVDLTRLAIESLGDAQAAGPDHGWVLEVGEEPVVIAGDEGRLHQVAANLLANARTHTPAGTTVTLSVAQEGVEGVLRVHDDGPGVDPAVADELFERFSRADRSRARKTGGTGLGLSIVRAIVEAHGGEISVDSAPGDTTFTVRLPAKPADPAPRATVDA